MSRAGQPRKWLALVGIGEDGVEGLSPAARALIANASLVVGGKRHLALADGLAQGEVRAWPSPLLDGIADILARRGRPVAVLASGDPFCYGVGATLARHVPADETICVPAPSSLSIACARLGWASNETATVSLCGRPVETLAPLLQPRARLLALSADASTPAAVAAYLTGRGFGGSTLHIMEALGGPRERIRATQSQNFGFNDVDALNLLAIEVEAGEGARVIPLSAGLPDDMFEHDGQITKREIRAVTLSALAPRAGERLWDIGCGSGSISIEWLLRHRANTAIAIEADATRAARAARNAADLGVPRLEVAQGRAPEALQGLAAPDAVFIGGGANRHTVDAAWAALSSSGRMVANGVTLDTEAALTEARARHGGTLTRLSVERLDRVGSKDAFRPALTVTQWSAVKP